MSVKNLFASKFFVPAITTALGLMLVAAAGVRGWQTESFIKRAVPTTGTVVALQQGVLAWNAEITVGYVDATGTAREARFETGGETTSHKKGDAVDLLYDPDNPSSVYVGNPRLRRHPVSGIYFLLGAGLVFFTARRWREGTLWG